MVCSLNANASESMTAAPTGFFVFIQYRLMTIKNTYTVSHCPQHAPSISVVGRAQTISITGSAAFFPAKCPAACIIASARA